MSHRIRCESPDRCINYCALLQELSVHEDTATMLWSASSTLVMNSIVPSPTLLPAAFSTKGTPHLPDQTTAGGVCSSNCTWAVNRLSVTTVTRTVLVSASQGMETHQPPVLASSNQESLWLTVAIITSTLFIGMVIISAVLACMLCLKRSEKSIDTKVKIHTTALSDTVQNQGMPKIHRRNFDFLNRATLT